MRGEGGMLGKSRESVVPPGRPSYGVTCRERLQSSREVNCNTRPRQSASRPEKSVVDRDKCRRDGVTPISSGGISARDTSKGRPHVPFSQPHRGIRVAHESESRIASRVISSDLRTQPVTAHGNDCPANGLVRLTTGKATQDGGLVPTTVRRRRPPIHLLGKRV